MDSFSCSSLNASFILEKLESDFQKILNTLRGNMVTSFKHYNYVTDRRATSVRLFVFYLSLGLVWVCEIEISRPLIAQDKLFYRQIAVRDFLFSHTNAYEIE